MSVPAARGRDGHRIGLPRESLSARGGGRAPRRRAGPPRPAARAGVPQIIVPHVLDQFYFAARRVVELGRSGRRRCVSSGRLDTLTRLAALLDAPRWTTSALERARGALDQMMSARATWSRTVARSARIPPSRHRQRVSRGRGMHEGSVGAAASQANAAFRSSQTARAILGRVLAQHEGGVEGRHQGDAPIVLPGAAHRVIATSRPSSRLAAGLPSETITFGSNRRRSDRRGRDGRRRPPGAAGCGCPAVDTSRCCRCRPRRAGSRSPSRSSGSAAPPPGPRRAAPARSSFSPGPSPMNMRSASGLPSPKTMFWRRSQSPQRVHSPSSRAPPRGSGAVPQRGASEACLRRL